MDQTPDRPSDAGVDSPRPDMKADLSPDQGKADARPDKDPPDLPAIKDAAPDKPKPDMHNPDMHKPDTLKPDMLMPDALKPDTLKPDTGPPPCVHPKVEKRCSELWCQVPPGCFTMGLRSGHTCGGLNETSHQVALSRQVVISETEVTQAQFSEVMKYSPTTTTACKTCPVDNVTWNEAAAYCNGLSTRAGLAGCYTCSGTKKSMTCSLAKAYQGGKLYACPGFRLPTSAEWEYAYRAGTTGSFYNGKISSCSTDSNAAKIGWYQGNALGLGKKVQKVGGKLENPLGLHDMAGNLWEWVHDYYKLDLGKVYVKDPVGPASGSSREYRGGCWKCQASDLRGARRNGVPPRATTT